METRINGSGSGLSTVKFGVPQGSVLDPTLFSLFCNDLPDIVDAGEGEIHMYADDTTIYVIGPTPDAVTTKLNTILSKFHDWCCLNLLTPHPEKTEFLLLGSRTFVGPMQAIRFGQCIVTQVESSRCLGLEIDCHLKWHKHVTKI